MAFVESVLIRDPITGDIATVTPQNALKVDGSAVTQPVSFSGSVPVTGGLTDAELRATPVPISGTVAATIADGADVAEGATTDAAITTDVNGTVSGKLRGLVKIIGGWIATLGQKTMANSAPVVIASDQTTIPVSISSSPLPTDAATETTLNAIRNATDRPYNIDLGTGAAKIVDVNVASTKNTAVLTVGSLGTDISMMPFIQSRMAFDLARLTYQ